jgi:hypothetical protein
LYASPVDWLLMADIGEVLKKIVAAEKFPDYHIPFAMLPFRPDANGTALHLL